MKNQLGINQARSRMEDAAARSEKAFSRDALPRRYKLYDKIKDHVSLRTIDAIIIGVSLLILALLIYGIATATPPQ